MTTRINRHRIEIDPETGTASIRHQRHMVPSHFGYIEGVPFLWIQEEEGAATRRYNYRIISTGEEIPDHHEYLKTATDRTGLTAHLLRG